jgi:flavin reductase (DIM6/NTAB) family NADH-FMN oxidoreductase RutF
MADATSADVLRGLAALTTGIYVLTVRDGDQVHGMSSSWVTQVSGDPPLVAVAVDRDHRTHAMLERGGAFALNVVGEKGRHLEDFFHSAAAAGENNLATVACDDSPDGPDGPPLLSSAMASLVCRVRDAQPIGDHTLFVATVERVVERGTDRALTSQDLDYVYVGTVVPQPRR